MTNIERVLIDWDVDSCTWLAGQIGKVIGSSGTLDLHTAWFTANYESMRYLAMMIAIIALLVAMAYAALTRDGAEIGRTLSRLLVAGLSTGAVITFVTWTDNLVNALCLQLLGGKDEASAWKNVTTALQTPVRYLKQGPGSKWNIVGETPLLITQILAWLMLLALLTIWAEMLVRALCIDTCVMFWPLIASLGVWREAREGRRRSIHTLLGLLLSKLFIVIEVRITHDQLLNMRSATDLLKGVGLLWLAAFAPFVMMRLIGFLDGAVQGHTGEGMRQAAIGAAVAAGMRATGMASTAGGRAASVMRRGGSTAMPALRGPDLADEMFGTPGQPSNGSSQSKSPKTPNFARRPVPPPPPPNATKGSGSEPGSPGPQGQSGQPAGHNIPPSLRGSPTAGPMTPQGPSTPPAPAPPPPIRQPPRTPPPPPSRRPPTT